ncbi:WD domain-containing protein [Xylariomycetidae sp. FL0641]|nr:WD domain-containing protein [Xylariomycetidae sp. FL0641]
MASTPTNRLRSTPSNSPFPARPLRYPPPGRSSPSSDSHLVLKRVVGTTCVSPTGFDAVDTSFAYIAGGAAVVADIDDGATSQRFYRARPTALPVYQTSSQSNSTGSPNSTPKANDSRNRVSLRESDNASRTWTSRERIKAATCLSLSKDRRFLAVGETGYAPRVLIYNLDDSSSDIPLVSISEHMHGVRAVAWSPDSKWLASLGSSNDGCLFVWKVDSKTGAASMFQQNRCISYIRGMVWMGSSVITVGVRHVKAWRVEETSAASPMKAKFGDPSLSAQHQKTLPGRNVLLGNLNESTFSCAAVIDETRAIICSDAGDVCLLDDSSKQMKLTRILETGFVITCVAIHEGTAYLGGKSGGFATIDVSSFKKGCSSCIQTTTSSSADTGCVALGFLQGSMISVNVERAIQIWELDSLPGQTDAQPPLIPIPGHQGAIMGVESLPRPNAANADFYSWSAAGQVVLWGVDGSIKTTFQMPLEQAYFEEEPDLVNQVTTIRATEGGQFFISGDRLGFIKIIELSTMEVVASLKAHASECQQITIHEDGSQFLMASCGRDRTAQLFHRTAEGDFAHFQTLEFAARVARVLLPSTTKIITCSLDRIVQVHDIVAKEDDPQVMAAISSRTLSLKASPQSMTMAPNKKSLLISLLDRSICVFDIESGKLSKSFKCLDENSVESVIMDSLTACAATDHEPAFIMGVSNTDKSIRLYDAHTGHFLDREWGHTEAINGVTLVEEEDGQRKVVSVGSDGTIMIWELDLQDRTGGYIPRDQPPVKDGPVAGRPTLRRVLSKAELAEFQRSSQSAHGRRSPPRPLSSRRSLRNLSSAGSLRNSAGPSQSSPRAPDNPGRRPSTSSNSISPATSPKVRVTRRPSLPALNTVKPKKSSSSLREKSSSNLRAMGSLDQSTEQTCRALKTYRSKLSSAESISQDLLSELDRELRLTAVALGDRVIRNKTINDTLLGGLLDQYSERLISLLDEKLRLKDYQRSTIRESESQEPRPTSSGTSSISSTST